MSAIMGPVHAAPRSLGLLLLSSLAAACGDDTSSVELDAAADVGRVIAEAGVPEAGALDADPSDAGEPSGDASPVDTGTVSSDAGAFDVGDAGALDSGAPDSAAIDSGTEVDAGTDGGGGVDAGLSTDSGLPIDSGLSLDASFSLDGGLSVDVGFPDSGLPVDGGVAPRRIFVTSTTQNANLGGLIGADAICHTQGQGLGGTFKAWLSTTSSAAAARLTHSTGPYVLVDGTVIADDWNDLVDGSIQAPINLDANGDPRSGDVWTGTLANGEPRIEDDCGGFTFDTSANDAQCGASSQTNSRWTENTTPNCTTGLRLYCIEQ